MIYTEAVRLFQEGLPAGRVAAALRITERAALDIYRDGFRPRRCR